MPQDTSGTFGLLPGQEAASGSADKAEAAQAMAMMKMMMKGLFVDVSLNVNGRILKSNATHVDGLRVTLMQIDFDKLLADETGLQKLQAASDVKSLSGRPGLKVVTEPTGHDRVQPLKLCPPPSAGCQPGSVTIEAAAAAQAN